jgi:hypothetical protein
MKCSTEWPTLTTLLFHSSKSDEKQLILKAETPILFTFTS